MEIKILDKSIAQDHIQKLVDLENLIPKVEGDSKEILSEKKGDRVMYGKWEHSLYAEEDSELIGFIIAYERKAEQNDQYPMNSLYINTIVVDPKFQNIGIGRKLILRLFDNFKQSGFKYLNGKLRVSVQTNSAEFNSKVQDFYKSFGFEKVSEKEYENRVDNIYNLVL